ncbi:hypothetical protein CHARACLAT_023785 [Characodon lateralis]|uniref:Uncharacterized protein n=1 Tax=Characodon lateralis TaxID=208331 RepID=A0ABU7F5K6_9TELE|nr:hypothetical protein [Characodon lateralis]
MIYDCPPGQIYLQHFYCWQQSVTQRARVGECSTPHPFCALNSLYESASYTLLNFDTSVTLLDRVSIPMLTRTQGHKAHGFSLDHLYLSTFHHTIKDTPQIS